MRKKGDRVYLLKIHEDTGEQKRRYGTIASDELEFWDYNDVIFDDLPGFVQPILSYYLHDEDQPNATDLIAAGAS